jgi:hypothetical protein
LVWLDDRGQGGSGGRGGQAGKRDRPVEPAAHQGHPAQLLVGVLGRPPTLDPGLTDLRPQRAGGFGRGFPVPGGLGRCLLGGVQLLPRLVKRQVNRVVLSRERTGLGMPPEPGLFGIQLGPVAQIFGLRHPLQLIPLPASGAGQPIQLLAQPRAAVPRPRRRGHDSGQSVLPGRHPEMGAGGLMGPQLGGPGLPLLPGPFGLAGGPGRAAIGAARALRRDPAGREQVGGTRSGLDQMVQRADGAVQLSPPPVPLFGPVRQLGQLGVDGDDPLLPVRGPGGRADVPGLVGLVASAQRAIAPAAVGEHGRGRARVFEPHGTQHRCDRDRGQGGRRVGAQRSHQGPFRPGRVGADEQLTVGG